MREYDNMETPNSNLTAEQGVVGSILIDARCLELIKVFDPADFEHEQTRDVASAIKSLIDEQRALDPVTVINRMGELGTATDSTRDYILQLMEITPTAANAGQYSTIVRKNSLSRQIADTANAPLKIGEKRKRLKELQAKLDAVEAGSKWASLEAKPASSIEPTQVPKSTYYIGTDDRDAMLTEGVYFLNGFSKVGKSRLMLQLLLALSTGDDFLGRPTKQCGVLYLALEDEHVDYQNRMLKMLQGREAPTTFWALTKEDCPDYITPTLDDGGGLEELIDARIAAHPEIKVIGIDVFTVIRSKATRSPIADDHRDATTLMRIASRHKIAIIVAHHVSKTDLRSSAKRGGAIGSGAGTFSLSGTVIGEYELSKDLDHDGMMIFRSGGRRIRESEISLKDRFPAFDYLGEYKDIAGTMDADRDDQNTLALIQTIEYICKEYADRATSKTWKGNASQIYEINVTAISKTEIMPLFNKPNKRTFTPAIINELKKKGILLNVPTNGNASPIYAISRIDSLYEQDKLNT